MTADEIIYEMRQRRAVDHAGRIVNGEYHSWRDMKEAERKRGRRGGRAWHYNRDEGLVRKRKRILIWEYEAAE